jgi:protein-S-isoprenylcysteine O-methyltransferase Ste14
MYLGLLMIGFGLSGLGDSATSWVIFTILFLDLQVKSRFEDHLLAELHPEAAHYQSHTSRIFPCLGSGCRAGAACSISDDTPGK